jgi:hypothetical protein
MGIFQKCSSFLIPHTLLRLFILLYCRPTFTQKNFTKSYLKTTIIFHEWLVGCRCCSVDDRIQKKKNYSVKSSRSNLLFSPFRLHPNHPILVTTAFQNPSGVSPSERSRHVVTCLFKSYLFTETHISKYEKSQKA